MKTLIMVAIAIGILAIAGVIIANAGFVKAADAQPKITSCQSCGGQCTAGNNCGLATCGAANGGKCTCGQK